MPWIAAGNPVADWRVTSDGRFYDAVGNQYATITGNSGVLPNTRHWGTVVSGGLGWVADFTNAVNVVIPTTGWSASGGAYLAVCSGVPTATSYLVGWRNTDWIALYWSNGYKFAAVAGANTQTATVLTDPTAPYTMGGRWADGAKAAAFTNGIKAESSGACGTPSSLPATTTVGSRNDGWLYFNKSISRLIIFGTPPSDATMQSTEMTSQLLRGVARNPMSKRLLLMTG